MRKLSLPFALLGALACGCSQSPGSLPLASAAALTTSSTLPAANSLENTPWTAYVSATRTPQAWAKTVRTNQTTSIASQLSSGDVIYVESEGLGSGRDAARVKAHMDSVSGDGGVAWRASVQRRALEFILSASGTSHTVYWQIGNEINSLHFSDTMGQAATPPVAGIGRNDSRYIAAFVEYYVAPTVEALHDAEAISGTDVSVMLGSIANGATPGAQSWLQQLLDYPIVGTYAPTLAGKRVSEVVEFLSMHYTVIRDNHQANLDWYTAWIGRDTIKGVWSTEELGRKSGSGGLGAATAVKVLARALSYWWAHSMSPEQGRVNWWGQALQPQGVTGSAGADAMDALLGFLGDTPLAERPGAASSSELTDYTTYAFDSINDPKRSVVFVVPASDASTASWTFVDVDAGGLTGVATAEVMVFTRTGSVSLTATATRVGGAFRVLLPNAVALSQRAAALVFLDKP